MMSDQVVRESQDADLEASALAFSDQFDSFVNWLRLRGVDVDDRPGSAFRKVRIAQCDLMTAMDMAALSRVTDCLKNC
jgi:hypothetical protein